MAEDLKLFRTWSSPFALRAVHALKIKGLDYETQFEDIKNKSAELVEYNPIHRKVPVLVHKGRPICESLVILEYIDEVWQQPPLLPCDPYDKAMARFWAKFGDDKVIKNMLTAENYLDPAYAPLDARLVPSEFYSNDLTYTAALDVGEQVMPSAWSVFISQGKEQEEAIGPFSENLRFLEEQLQGKRFFGGERIGYLDIALGWMANLISIWEEIIELKFVAAEEFPRLSAWMDNFSEEPVIKESWPPRDKMIDKFKAARESHLKQSA